MNVYDRIAELERENHKLEQACLILIDAHQKLLGALEHYGLIQLTSDNDEHTTH